MQTHLDSKQTINLGSFYTPKDIVLKAYVMLESKVKLKDFLLFDSSCGYGDFFLDFAIQMDLAVDSKAVDCNLNSHTESKKYTESKQSQDLWQDSQSVHALRL